MPITVALLLSMTWSAPADEPPDSRSAATTEATDIGLQAQAIEEHTLENGLHVIIAPDDRLPIVATHMLYRVGSRDEREGRSGFAHLFEHLMFMGTERAPNFDTAMEAGGGTNNAGTTEDWTSYYASGPSNLLETLLWLEADRLATLAEAMTEEKLDIQRDVVKNERRRNYEDAPYGQTWLLIPKVLFPPGHGYHEPVIGSHEDLEAASVDDVVEFFRTYYTPSNASLVIAGDVDPDAALSLVEKHFGEIPGGEPVERVQPPPVEPISAQREVVRDDVELPRVTWAWRSPELFDEGDAELDIAAHILAAGKNSRLYRALVFEQRLASDVSATQWSGDLGSVFVVELTAAEGVDADRLAAAGEAELARLRSDPPSTEELERARNAIEIGYVRRLQRQVSRARLLNRYWFHTGDPTYLEEDVARYRNASAESVRRFVSATLDPARRFTLVTLPRNGDDTGAADSTDDTHDTLDADDARESAEQTDSEAR